MNYQEFYEAVFSQSWTISHVHRVARHFNIDGRAIAGAIRWEIYFNPRGYWSDIIQRPLGRIGFRSGNGIGWGSMHWSVADELRVIYPSDKTIQECTVTTSALTTCLSTLPTALHMIAAEMNRAASAYETFAGVFLRNRPELLAALYQLGKSEARAKAFAARRQTDPRAQPDIASSPMGQHVRDSLHLLKAFETHPTLPAILEERFRAELIG